MPIPFILGAIALGTAAYGVAKGAEGVGNIKEANEIGQRAKNRHEYAVNELELDWENTNKLAEEYGKQQINVKIETIGRFVAFIEKIGQRAKQDLEFLEGLEGISIQQIQEYKADVMQAEQFFKGGIKAVVAGAAAGQAATGLATSVGVAGTGAAISGLSGAAAWNATLAWLGGGSLAAGGGGMALGTVVLGGITVGPALAVGGFVIAGKGEKALTQAREYEAKVNTEIAKIETARDFLEQLRRRIEELSIVLENLNKYAVLSLNQLESQPFDTELTQNGTQIGLIPGFLLRNNQAIIPILRRFYDLKIDAVKFQQVALLIKALAEIMKTSILDNEGKLNPATANLQAKYRTLGVS